MQIANKTLTEFKIHTINAGNITPSVDKHRAPKIEIKSPKFWLAIARLTANEHLNKIQRKRKTVTLKVSKLHVNNTRANRTIYSIH